jgi:hypothetical protein
MGGEWSKAVKMIFNKKYSNGRGKLVDAMKDPETKAVHAKMLGKKPKAGKTRKHGGEGSSEIDGGEEDGGNVESDDDEPTKGGNRKKNSKSKSRKNKSSKRSKSFRKKSGW